MKKKIFIILTFFIILLLFFIIYNNINNDSEKYVLILFFILSSLFLRKINLFFSISLIILSIIFSFFTFGFSINFIILFSVSLAVIPVFFIFRTSNIKQYPKTKRRNDELKFYKEELLNEKNGLNSQKDILETKLERITNFYIISKDLTRNLNTPEESANALLNVLASRTGIYYVVITTKNINNKKENNSLQIVSRLDEQKKEQWYKLINNNSEVENLKEAKVVKSLFCIEQKPVIAWPIIIDNKLNSCSFLVIEPEYTQRYIEEGMLFIPHLKLGTKRLMFFSELKEKARIDGLTGLYLKRYFLEKLSSEIEKVKRYNTDFYIMMLDIDFFKKVNDTYGHLMGDMVLTEVAKIISSSIRPGDIAGRYGGEEFIILLPIIKKEHVFDIAEGIRKSVQNTIFKHNKEKISITISIGISTFIKGLTIEKLIENTDNALYKAKKLGRNKTIFF